ncbi:MAG: pentapeptide repeat-containing protein [Heteroscytonema crispum UTEX LB 1556]
MIVYGDINKPQVLATPPMVLPALPISKYWFFMNISWSRLDGFEFKQYSDPEIAKYNSINSSPLNLNTVRKLRGLDKIQINKGVLNLTFRAEVNQTDLGDNDPRSFLEKCSEFGITVVDVEFSGDKSFYKINCSRSQWYNVTFIDYEMEFADCRDSILNNVRFLKSNIKGANFSNCKFYNTVEFYQSDLKESAFDNCKVITGKTKVGKDEEILIFNNCDLNSSKFIQGEFCARFENSDLSNADFLEATILDSKFYDCTLNKTNFTKTRFDSYSRAANKSQSQNPNKLQLVTCRIGSKQVLGEKTEIIDCLFNNALIREVDISGNKIMNTDFEAADLSKAKLYNCEFINTQFHGKTQKSTNLTSADISFSLFQGCDLNEADLTRVRMIEARIDNCNFVRSTFYSARLRGCNFISSDLTGVDFRNADLTLVKLHECHLTGANFFKTQRSGMKLNLESLNQQQINENDNGEIKHNNCTIKYIEWNPKRDGEIQINEEDFLSIINGKQSALAVISNLCKGNPSFVSYVYTQAQAEANAKSAGNDLNDASMNFDSDVNNSDISGSSIEPKYGVEPDEDNLVSNESNADELS